MCGLHCNRCYKQTEHSAIETQLFGFNATQNKQSSARKRYSRVHQSKYWLSQLEFGAYGKVSRWTALHFVSDPLPPAPSHKGKPLLSYVMAPKNFRVCGALNTPKYTYFECFRYCNDVRSVLSPPQARFF